MQALRHCGAYRIITFHWQPLYPIKRCAVVWLSLLWIWFFAHLIAACTFVRPLQERMSMREVMDIPDFSELLYGGLSYSFDKRLEFVNSEYNKITATSLAIIVSARMLPRRSRLIHCFFACL